MKEFQHEEVLTGARARVGEKKGFFKRGRIKRKRSANFNTRNQGDSLRRTPTPNREQKTNGKDTKAQRKGE